MTPMLDDVPKITLEAIRMQRKIADVEDIVGTYLFLSSSAAGHFQGQCLSRKWRGFFL
jgi:hypothetical protein